MEFSPLSKREEEIAKLIVDSAYHVHKNLGPGLLEKVYEVCFCHEVKKRGLKCERQISVPIKYDGIIFDEGFRLDVLVEDSIICELKAVDNVNSVWISQLLSHLKLTNHRLGFLINFNVPVIKDGIKRIIRWKFLCLRAFVAKINYRSNMNKIKLNIKRISEKFNDIALPHYATEGSAGMDVRAAIDDKLTIKSGEVKLVPTNLKVEIPVGYEIQVRPRSGLALKHGIGLLNSPGTIDSDYRGEVGIIMSNFSKNDFVVNRGDRIAQLVLTSYSVADVIEVKALSDSQRGEGGFGHTGKN